MLSMLKRHEVEILLKAGHGKTEVARLTGAVPMLGEPSKKEAWRTWSVSSSLLSSRCGGFTMRKIFDCSCGRGMRR
jgi:hypothetical protein